MTHDLTTKAGRQKAEMLVNYYRTGEGWKPHTPQSVIALDEQLRVSAKHYVKFRHVKVNTSLSPFPVWKWKVQKKVGRFWKDVRSVQGTKLFDHPNHATNYINILIHSKAV
jgi:hypothetical protein